MLGSSLRVTLEHSQVDGTYADGGDGFIVLEVRLDNSSVRDLWIHDAEDGLVDGWGRRVLNISRAKTPLEPSLFDQFVWPDLVLARRREDVRHIARCHACRWTSPPSTSRTDALTRAADHHCPQGDEAESQ